MSDPYGRKYATAGNPYVAADGQSLLGSAPSYSAQYTALYGNEDAAIVFAEDVNRQLLSSNAALLTTDGVVAMSGVRALLQEHGYTGSNDISEMAQFYRALKTPPPPTPTPAGTNPLSASLGGSVAGLPMPVILGGGLLLLFMLGGRRR